MGRRSIFESGRKTKQVGDQRIPKDVILNAGDLDLESLLSLSLADGADPKTDTNPSVSLVDESSAVGKKGDARCARCCHDVPPIAKGGDYAKDHARWDIATGSRIQPSISRVCVSWRVDQKERPTNA